MKIRVPLLVLLSACPGLVAGGVAAGDRPYAVTETRESCASYHPQRTAWFGDLHVHTAFSQDASTQGTRNTPRDAYRFAKGEPLGIQPWGPDGQAGRTLQLARPLDFAAVTDHAELLGEVHICNTPGMVGYTSLACVVYRNLPRVGFFWMNTRASLFRETRFGFCGEDGAHCREAALVPWGEIQAAAEGAYDRTPACSFTTFVAYEYTASENSDNLHRNVVFRNEVVPHLPTSFYEAEDAEALWAALRADCLEPGECEVAVIPHNSNISNGRMFQTEQSDGTAIDRRWARTRAALEPVVEVMQHKGDSECSLVTSPEDELCGFEKLPYQNFGAQNFESRRTDPDPRSYTRAALREGLKLEEQLGVNPFRFGVIASTDTHLAAAGATESVDYPGHGGAGKYAAEELPEGFLDNVEFNPGGLAAVWAEENTRDAIFAALRRREVFGTSGPRMSVRLFGSWEFADDWCESPDGVAIGYADGVPMGSVLAPGPEGEAPAFAVSGWRDPGTPGSPGSPLGRLQIVKGWAADGATHERVYDVAGGGDASAGVDPATCEPHGKGADQLCAVWRDPEFSPGQRAFYYARVVENPTCRWTTRVCNANQIDCGDPSGVPEAFAGCCDPALPKTVRQRAWSSPIWYSPAP